MPEELAGRELDSHIWWRVFGQQCLAKGEDVAPNYPERWAVPSFSRSWQQMGALVKRMRELGWTYRLVVHPDRERSYEATFNKLAKNLWVTSEWDSESAPDATARAALRALEAERG